MNKNNEKIFIALVNNINSSVLNKRIVELNIKNYEERLYRKFQVKKKYDLICIFENLHISEIDILIYLIKYNYYSEWFMLIYMINYFILLKDNLKELYITWYNLSLKDVDSLHKLIFYIVFSRINNLNNRLFRLFILYRKILLKFLLDNNLVSAKELNKILIKILQFIKNLR